MRRLYILMCLPIIALSSWQPSASAQDDPPLKDLFSDIEGPFFEERLDKFRAEFEKCYQKQNVKGLAEVVGKHRDLSVELLRIYTSQYVEECRRHIRKLNRGESGGLDKILYLMEAFDDKEMKEVVRTVRDWSFESIDLKCKYDRLCEGAVWSSHTGEYGFALTDLQECLDGYRQIGDRLGLIKTLVYLGEVEAQQGNTPSALAHLEKARDESRKLNDLYHLAMSLEKLGVCCYYQHYQGRLDYAWTSYESALSIYRRLGCRWQAYNVMEGLSAVMHGNGRLSEAETVLRILIDHHKGLGDPINVSKLLHNLTMVLMDKGSSHQNMLETCEEALELARQCYNAYQEANCLFLKGRILADLGDREEALACYRAALSIFQKQGVPRLQWQVQANICECLNILGRFDESEEIAGKTLASVEKWGDLFCELNFKTLLSDIAYFEGDMQRGDELMEKVLILVEGLNHPYVSTNLYCSYSRLLLSQGRYADAHQYARKAVEIVSHSQLLPSEKAAIWFTLGRVYLTFRRYDEARACYETGFELSGMERCCPLSIMGLASVLEAMGDYKSAEEMYRKALEAAKARGLKNKQAVILSSFAGFHLAQKEYDAAMDCLHKALEGFEEVHNRVGLLGAKIDISECLVLKERYDEALELLQEVEKNHPALNHDRYSMVLGLTALALFMKGDLEKAHEYFEKSMAGHEQLLLALDALSEISEGSLFTNTANWVFLSALGCNESLYGKTRDPRFIDQGFEISERRRARIFLKYLANASLNIEPSVSRERMKKFREHKAAVASIHSKRRASYARRGAIGQERMEALNSEWIRAMGRLEEDMESIAVEDPSYAHIRNPYPLSLEEFQKLLGPSTAYVSFAVGEREAFVLAADQEECRLHPIQDHRAVREKARVLFHMVEQGTGTIEEFSGLSRELYIALLKPVEGLLEGKEQILLSSDGVFNFLPIDVLLTSDPPGGSDVSFKDLPFLVRTFAVSHVPSATSLYFLRDRRDEKNRIQPYESMKDLLALGPYGNADEKAEPQGLTALAMNQGDLTWLPNCEREVRSIRGFFPEKNSTLLLGEAANESVVTGRDLDDYRIIHFATHALVDEKIPLLSSIVLNPSGEEDGYWMVFEIFKSSIRAEMIVLSACSTNRGKVVSGEGVYSLVRALLYAGADSVVATNWKVGDQFSALFMEDFYGNMKNGLPRSKALQRAKIAAIRGDIIPESGSQRDEERHADPVSIAEEDVDYARPFCWAPFILVGLP